MPAVRERYNRSFTLNLTDELRADLQTLADQRQATLGSMARQWLHERVEREKAEAEVQRIMRTRLALR